MEYVTPNGKHPFQSLHIQLKGNFLKLLEPIVALTGAGISAESGIPTFRGDEGLWRKYRAEELATPEAFHNDPLLVWQFYDWRRQLVVDCSPNPAHLTIAHMQQSVREFSLITQNVDGLHFRAGNRHVVELHGSLWRLKCTSCGNRWKDHQVPLPMLPPYCPSCKGLARPDVVWFGEMLATDILQRAEQIATNAATMLVIGTSALIQPACLLPLIAKKAGAKVIEFNLQTTSLSPYADETIVGPAGQTLPKWWKQYLRNNQEGITVL
jgi:NAD-dependent deacetylase